MSFEVDEFRETADSQTTQPHAEGKGAPGLGSWPARLQNQGPDVHNPKDQTPAI